MSSQTPRCCCYVHGGVLGVVDESLYSGPVEVPTTNKAAWNYAMIASVTHPNRQQEHTVIIAHMMVKPMMGIPKTIKTMVGI